MNRRPISISEHQALDPSGHPALHEGRVALITGAASGIGFAAAKAFANLGLKVALTDINEAKLKEAEKVLVAEHGEANIFTVKCDVSKVDDVAKMKDAVLDHFGEVNVLLNNAGIATVGRTIKDKSAWEDVLNVNLWGVINMLQAFVPAMTHQENAGIVINTGSKQGITSPPGNAAYNVSKAAVKVLTENLSHELREKQSKLTAHLFLPGWTWTGMTNPTGAPKKPDGAWTADETISYLLARLQVGEFYILCPDNETSSELDKLRIRWAADDITEGRPALSRWHPEYKAAYDEFIRDNLGKSWTRPTSVEGMYSHSDLHEIHDNL
jgi:NAD(P)-dependent dehydrogenase (short-subunit alcohol dehydrogenase family)